MLSSWTRMLRQMFAKPGGTHKKQFGFGTKRFLLNLENLEERAVPTVYTVTNTLDLGAGSLRQGILSGDTTIDFNIPTSDPHYNSSTHVFTISPASALPGIVTSVLIDG